MIPVYSDRNDDDARRRAILSNFLDTLSRATLTTLAKTNLRVPNLLNQDKEVLWATMIYFWLT